MKSMLSAIASLVLAAGVSVPANAKVPELNHTCPIGIGMFTDANGRVYVDAQEAVVKAIDGNHYTATIPGVVISIAVNPDGSPRVSYAAKGAKGPCSAVPPPSEDNG